MKKNSLDEKLKAMRPIDRVRFANKLGLRIRHVPDGLTLKPELYQPKEQHQ